MIRLLICISLLIIIACSSTVQDHHEAVELKRSELRDIYNDTHYQECNCSCPHQSSTHNKKNHQHTVDCTAACNPPLD